MNEAAAQQEEEDGGVRGHLQTMPSRSKSNFTNVMPLGAKGEPQGIAWGSCSAGQRLKTYIAVPSDVDRTKLPEDQVIKTEKLNILLKHFYALGDGGHKASNSKAKGGAMDKGKSKKRINAFPNSSGNSSAAKRQMQNK
jgi:hypothetical protein